MENSSLKSPAAKRKAFKENCFFLWSQSFSLDCNEEAVFLNLVYLNIASTFGSTDPLSSTDDDHKNYRIYRCKLMGITFTITHYPLPITINTNSPILTHCHLTIPSYHEYHTRSAPTDQEKGKIKKFVFCIVELTFCLFCKLVGFKIS